MFKDILVPTDCLVWVVTNKYNDSNLLLCFNVKLHTDTTEIVPALVEGDDLTNYKSLNEYTSIEDAIKVFNELTDSEINIDYFKSHGLPVSNTVYDIYINDLITLNILCTVDKDFKAILSICVNDTVLDCATSLSELQSIMSSSDFAIKLINEVRKISKETF